MSALVILRGFNVDGMMAAARALPIGQQKTSYYNTIINTLGTSWRFGIRAPGQTGSHVYRSSGGSPLQVVNGKLVLPLQFVEPPTINVANNLVDAYISFEHPTNNTIEVLIPITVGQVEGFLSSTKILNGIYTVRNGGVEIEAPLSLDVIGSSNYLPEQLVTDVINISDARPLISILEPIIATESMYGGVSPEYIDSSADFIAPMFRFVPTDPTNSLPAPNSRLEIRNLRLWERPSAIFSIVLQPVSPEYLFEVGNSTDAYWILNNTWGAGTITRGTASNQYEQYVGREPSIGTNGEVGWRMKWRWPNPPGSSEVKGYPAAIQGRKPGMFNSSSTPGGHSIMKLDGSLRTETPSGGTAGTFFPLQLPISTLFTKSRVTNLTSLTGEGHLAYDIWLQSVPEQQNGFYNSAITHEIMIPLQNWGGYGNVANRNSAWYDHDVTIDGRLYHVFAYGKNGNTFDYSFGSLSGAFGKTGWKFIIFQPDVLPIPDGTILDLAKFINHISSRVDGNGTPWALGNEYCVSVELGVEPKVGSGDMIVYDYKVDNAAISSGQELSSGWLNRRASSAAADLSAEQFYSHTGYPSARVQTPVATTANSVLVNLDEFRHSIQPVLLGFLKSPLFTYPSSGLKSTIYNVQMEARKVLINSTGTDDRANVRVMGQVFGDWRYPTTKSIGNVGMIGDSMTAGAVNIHYSDVDHLATLLTAGAWTYTLVGIENKTSWPGARPVMASAGWTMSDITSRMAAIVAAAPRHIVVNLGYNDIQVIGDVSSLTTHVMNFYNGLFSSTSGITGRVIWACIPVQVDWLDAGKYEALANTIIAWVRAGDGITRRLIDLRRAGLNLTTGDGSADATHWSLTGAQKVARTKMTGINRHLNEVAFQSRWKLIPNDGAWTLLSATNISSIHPYYDSMIGALTAEQLLENPPPLIERS